MHWSEVGALPAPTFVLHNLRATANTFTQQPLNTLDSFAMLHLFYLFYSSLSFLFSPSAHFLSFPVLTFFQFSSVQVADLRSSSLRTCSSSLFSHCPLLDLRLFASFFSFILALLFIHLSFLPFVVSPPSTFIENQDAKSLVTISCWRRLGSCPSWARALLPASNHWHSLPTTEVRGKLLTSR